jgi:hypothetical protein
VGGAGANGCLTTAVLIVAPSYSIVLWFTQPPRRSINNSTGWLASIGTPYSRFAPPIKPRAPGGMVERRDVAFEVEDGDRLRGWLCQPEGKGGRRRAISIAHGYAA